MHTRPAHTLPELCLVLVLAGTLLGMAVPHVTAARDRLAVRAALHELAGAIAVTRAAAIRNGGASLHIEPGLGLAWIVTAGGERLPHDYPVRARYGVAVESDGSGTTVLRYDALGIGRLANVVLRCRRGQSVGSLTVSAYGRVRL
jgi:type II secretory pathway pseudopilin PulG